METIFPIFLVCIVPLFSHGLVFLLGRWSTQFTVQRRGDVQPTAANAYYDYPVEERYTNAR